MNAGKMPKETAWVLAHEERAAVLNVMGRCVERGGVAALRTAFGFSRFIDALSSDAEKATLDNYRRWLEEAEAYEEVHGKGSKAVPDHPFYRDVLPEFRRNYAKAKTQAEGITDISERAA